MNVGLLHWFLSHPVLGLCDGYNVTVPAPVAR
jgi:hypothetical protein